MSHRTSRSCRSAKPRAAVSSPRRDAVALIALAAYVLTSLPAAACGVMGLSGGIGPVWRIQEGDVGTGLAAQEGYTVSTTPGDTCFVALELPTALDIAAIRFEGRDGGEFETFREDPALAESFGPGYRAWSAEALTTVDLESFTLEVDYVAPSPSIELPRIGDAFLDGTIATGQTDGAGTVLDHASLYRVTEVELVLAD